MMTIKKVTLITLALLIINGCSGMFSSSNERHFTSEVSLKNSTINHMVTEDMLRFIQNYYPLKSTFFFQLNPSAYKQGEVIEDALRNAGYGVSYIKKKGRIPFAYKIDYIDEEIMRTTYNIGSATLSRLYRIRGEKAIPTSPFTTRGLRAKLPISSNLNHYRKSSYNPSSSTEIRRAMVKMKALNIRDRPTSKGKVIGKYYKDMVIYVDSPITNKRGGRWSRVVQDPTGSTNNKEGYIASRFIKYMD
jgi:hypothetical protein